MEATVRDSHLYRLRGVVAGVETTIDLGPGEHRVGSTPRGEVALPVPGVSREHAILMIAGNSLVVEDRGSRNGTFIDEIRVERGTVASGSELRFGPVRLRVDRIEPGDTDLAIVLAEPKWPQDASWNDSGTLTAPSSLVLDETTRLAGEDGSGPGRWLDVADAFLLEPPATALATLTTKLEVAGGAILEYAALPPTVVVSSGEIHDLPTLETLLKLQGQGLHGIETLLFDAEPPTAVAIHSAAARILVVWGDFPSRSHCGALFSHILRLIERRTPKRHGEPLAGATPPTENELAFPTDYLGLESAPMRNLYRQMRQLSRGDLAVLILGETGVGKERIARILHLSSERAAGPFVAINCAAIPADLLEAEMFGINKGVATGVQERCGRFQSAAGGTLFLDEIGEMPVALQAKLLRALQEKEIYPLGGTAESVDVRVMAATNAELQHRMDEGIFRRDLYYRLAGYVLRVPALRECRDDIAALVEHFLHAVTRDSGRRVRGVTVKALETLRSYAWPGNIRELEHEIRRLVYLCHDGQAIDSNGLSDETAGRGTPGPSRIPLDPLALDLRIRELETHLVREALRRTGGNQSQAARLLEITRNGLAKKMKRLGIQSP